MFEKKREEPIGNFPNYEEIDAEEWKALKSKAVFIYS